MWASIRRTPLVTPRILGRLQAKPFISARFLGSTPLLQPTNDHLQTLLNGTNSNVLESLYTKWQTDPTSVNESFQNLFSMIDTDTSSSPDAAQFPTDGKFNIHETLRVLMLTRAFRTRGHLTARLDPLNLTPQDRDMPPYLSIQELDYKGYGFTEADLDKTFYVGNDMLLGGGRPTMTLREILDVMKRSYTGNVGVEYRHLLSKEQKDWIQQQVENPDFLKTPIERKAKILSELARADQFETFLAKKRPAAKRFGLEGGETTIVGIQALLDEGSELGLKACVIGMAHRGRLNVLGNVVGKPLEKIFAEFEPSSKTLVEGSGDVKYHLGTSSDITLDNGKVLRLTLTANPSHLEAVNPVVVGKTRAKQYYTQDVKRTENMGLLIHGDAAFAGQGVVAETLALGDLHNYTTGGSIHIIINNQIGFTTDPKHARSSPYPSDVAKMIACPIFHVNGDDPEAVDAVCRLAMRFRMQFHEDVVVDIFCYRRHGHNESDEPTFTQPIMYDVIQKHPPTLQLYKQRLLAEGSISKHDIDTVIDNININLEKKYELSRDTEVSEMKRDEWLENHWKGIRPMWAPAAKLFSTAVPKETIMTVGEALCRYPETFNIHRGVKRVIENKKKMFETGEGFDWGTAEALALGTLLLEKRHVRISGQDCERGTFSHRHAVLTDVKTEDTYTPLKHIHRHQGNFSVSNSNLSEFACLGFELGFSLEHPQSLVIWEAQFGDFANGAQIIIDNFIVSGEQKWVRQSGLTMLLPHGYDGQGPEHSSARLERFLQLCDDDPDVFPTYESHTNKFARLINIQVVNITSPANYFHCLRRQLHRQWRKPLIVMSPKSLLRAKVATSSIDEFTNKEFMPLIPETSTDLVPASQIRRVIFCSGKVYYDLAQRREEAKVRDVAIVRVEEIAPFPYTAVEEVLSKYSNTEDIVWCQEEPKNAGAWAYVQPRLLTTLRHLKRPMATFNGKEMTSGAQLRYVGRAPAAAPATGSAKVHAVETEVILTNAFA